jgi:hypothetical protein
MFHTHFHMCFYQCSIVLFCFRDRVFVEAVRCPQVSHPFVFYVPQAVNLSAKDQRRFVVPAALMLK